MLLSTNEIACRESANSRKTGNFVLNSLNDRDRNIYILAGNPAYGRITRPRVERGTSPSRSITLKEYHPQGVSPSRSITLKEHHPQRGKTLALAPISLIGHERRPRHGLGMKLKSSSTCRNIIVCQIETYVKRETKFWWSCLLLDHCSPYLCSNWLIYNIGSYIILVKWSNYSGHQELPGGGDN